MTTTDMLRRHCGAGRSLCVAPDPQLGAEDGS